MVFNLSPLLDNEPHEERDCLDMVSPVPGISIPSFMLTDERRNGEWSSEAPEMGVSRGQAVLKAGQEEKEKAF